MVVVLASAMSPMLANAKLAVQGQAGVVVPLTGVVGSGVMVPGQMAPLTVAIVSHSGRRLGSRLRGRRHLGRSGNANLNSTSGRRLSSRLRGRRHLGRSGNANLNSTSGRRLGSRLRGRRHLGRSGNANLNSTSGRRHGIFLRTRSGRR